MITKEEALRAFTILEPRSSGFRTAKDKVRQFIEQQPDSKPSAQVPEEKEVPDLLNSYDDMGGYWDIGYAEGWNDCRQAMLNQSQEG